MKKDITKILGSLTGAWKNHPVFGKKSTRAIIAWLRGDDTVKEFKRDLATLKRLGRIK